MNALEYAQNAQGSFTIPDILFKVKELLEDESSTMEDFANVISVDPSLTSHLLKMANSAIYCFPGEISTISRAITVIGTQAIYSLMLVDLAATAFKHFSTTSIDTKRFWQMSVYCALATKNLALKAGVGDIERLFVAGLLQNFGELIVARQSPKKAEKCEQYYSKHMPWAVQNKIFDFVYADVTAELLKLWQIPEKIILPIRHFNSANSIQINKDVKVLYLASRLSLCHCYPEHYELKDLIDHKMARDLNITEEDLTDCIDFADAETNNILSIMHADMF